MPSPQDADIAGLPASPFRLPPKLRATAATAVAPAETRGGPFRRSRQGPAREEVESPAPDRAPAPAAVALRAEAVFLGNLPGFGAPWLAQYVHHLAQRDGPVAVLHVDQSQIDLELVRPLHQRAAVTYPRSSDLIDLLAQLCQDSQAPVRHWIIHLPVPITPGTLAMARDLADWTILCGSDDAAVVSTYGLMTRMLEGDPARESRRLGVAIMGSDAERAAAAVGKLRQAAAGSLPQGLELRTSQKQMGPVNLQNLGTYRDVATLWPQVVSLLQTMAEQETDREFEPEPAAEASYVFPGPVAKVDRPPAVPASLLTPARPPAPPVEEPEPVAAKHPEPVTAKRPEPAEPPRPAAAAPPAPAPQPAQPVAAEPELATFLTDVGGVALAAHCPRRPETQLLLDQDGRLHLLGRHLHDPKQDPAATLQAAVLDLLEARAWVREHVELLRLTQRQCRFDLAAEPVLHLFTDQARLAVALAGRLGSSLRLHLLQQVRVGEASTWVSTPLS